MTLANSVSGKVFTSSPAVIEREPVLQGNYEVNTWDLHPDGDRIVVAQDVQAAAASPDQPAEPERFIIYMNFFEELRGVVGGN